MRPLPQTTFFFPPSETSVTVFCSPGSKRTLAPDGTLSRRPSESLRSNTNAGFVSRNAGLFLNSRKKITHNRIERMNICMNCMTLFCFSPKQGNHTSIHFNV